MPPDPEPPADRSRPDDRESTHRTRALFESMDQGVVHSTAEELARQNDALATILEVSKTLVSTLEVEQVLQAATDGVTKLFGLDTAAVYLLEGETLRLGATTPPIPPDFPEEMRSAPRAEHPHIDRALVSGEPVLVPDFRTATLTPAERAVGEMRGLRTLLFLPLVAGTQAVGVFIAGTVAQSRALSEDDIRLSRTLANLAALAVENSLLYASGRRYASELERQIADRKRAEQERLEMERRLLHAQKLESLGVLAGGIAHDFNNLLMAVLGNLDLALLKLSPVSPSRAFIEQSIQAARRAADLTRQMLAYSGRGRFVLEALDVSDLAQENAHLFRSSVPRTIALDLALGRPLPSIEADPGQIQQVIMNLITNAAEATGAPGGRITLSTYERLFDERELTRSRIEPLPPPGRFVVLEVSDTGCGMDEETQQRLFEPFFSTKATGRGLGMAAILGIVRGHRGAILIESGADRGTTIRILFPALEEAQTKPAESSDAPGRPEKAQALGGTVLIVDDEEHVRRVCTEMVQALGMRPVTASDGREAVELFRRNPGEFDVVLLDLTMPNLDGMSACAELRRIRPEVKVVLCSGYDERDSLPLLSGKEFAGFLQKPYSLALLREALERAFEWGRTRGE
ncbi:MAG: hypothetical protein Kow00128_09420 [Deltaproteobacteria bacterium]